MMASARHLVVALFAPLFFLACGGGDAPIERVDPESCAGTWQVVHSNPTSVAPDRLMVRDGRVYFNQRWGRDNGVWSIPTGGGAASLLRRDDAVDLWMETDQLLYLSEGVLFRVPIAGGSPEALPVQIPEYRTDGPRRVAWELDAEALYWVEHGYARGESSLWRAGRVDGLVAKLADFPPDGSYDQVDVLASHGGQLLGTNRWLRSELVLVDKAGGATREVPNASPASRYLGASLEGEVLWESDSGVPDGTIEGARFRVEKGGLDGTALVPFWTDKPAHLYPMGAWSRGNGGWYVAALQWGPAPDDRRHATIWSVEPDGRGTRLACDQMARSHVAAAVVAPDGLYAAIQRDSSWQLVRVTAP
jgi:hypothetical protein